MYKYEIGIEIQITLEGALRQWNEIVRETITLTEYVCDGGYVRFLTDDLRFISFHGMQPKKLNIVDYKDKCHKAPKARSYKVYADTLELVEEEEVTNKGE